MGVRRNRAAIAALTLLALALSARAAHPAEPDLLPTGARGASTLYASEPAHVVVEIENAGSLAECEIRVDATLGGATRSVAYARHDAGAVQSYTLGPWTMGAGDHALTVEVVAPACAERTRDNNVAQFTLSWVPRPTVSAALAASPSSGRAPLDVAFAPASPEATSWSLAFGDGTSANGQGPPPATVHHRYADAGAYDATLVARNGASEARATSRVVVAPPGPTREVALVPSPAEGRVPLAVAFEATNAADALRWRLAFGDGESLAGEGAMPVVHHEFRVAGSHRAILALDFADETLEATATVRALAASNDAPAVAFALAPPRGEAPLAVVASIGAADADGIASWRLVWGDGAAVAGTGAPPATLAHTYADAGSFRAVFEAQDASGVAGAASALVEVVGGTGLVAGAPHLAVDPAPGSSPRSFAFVAGCTCRDVVRWTLDFGDGASVWGTGTPPPIPHVYAKPGAFVARFEATTLRGVVGSAPVRVVVEGDATLRLAVALDGPTATLSVASDAIDEAPWEVALPGGRRATGVGDASFAEILAPGVHEIALRHRGVVVDRATIEIAPPLAPTLEANATSGRAPLPVSLVPRFDAPVLHWALAFGDGEVASGAGAPPAAVAHVYGPGRHVARLVVVAAWGEAFATESVVAVEARPPLFDAEVRPGLLVLRGEPGDSVAIDGEPVATFLDPGFLRPAPRGGEGPRHLPCSPGPHVVRVATPWGASERSVVCVGPQEEASVTTTELPAPSSAPFAKRLAPASGFGAALALLGAALRRRGAVFLLAGGLLAASLAASHVNPLFPERDTSGFTTGEEVVRFDPSAGAASTAIAVVLPDGTRVVGESPLPIPPGRLRHGTWVVAASPTGCSGGGVLSVSPFDFAVRTLRCAPIYWSFVPGEPSSFLVVGAGRERPATVVTDTRATTSLVVGEYGAELYFYHPLAPEDYTDGVKPRTVASLLDYDVDGVSTTSEIARGKSCPVSTRGGDDGWVSACAAAAELPYSGPDPAPGPAPGLRAEFAWAEHVDGAAWAGVPNEGVLTVHPPAHARSVFVQPTEAGITVATIPTVAAHVVSGPVTRAEASLPEGWTLDEAATRARLHPSWSLSVEDRTLTFLLRASDREDGNRPVEPVAFPLVAKPGPGGADRNDTIAVYAASNRDVALGASGEAVARVLGDASAPKTTHDAPRWARSHADVRLASTDAESGVARVEHRIGDGPWIASDAFRLALDGPEATFSYRSIDRAGNVEEARSFTVRRDAVPPEVALDPPPELSRAPVRVVAVAHDAESGVVGSGVRLPGGPVASSLLLDADGEHVVEAFAVDASGNEAVARATYVVDLPGKGGLAASVDPAVPRPGETAVVTLRFENRWTRALTDVAISLGEETVAFGVLEAGEEAVASFARRVERTTAFDAAARFSTPWSEHVERLEVPVPVAPLHALRLACLPVVAPPGSAASLPCSVRNDGDASERVVVAADGATRTLDVPAGALAFANLSLSAFSSGERLLRVVATAEDATADALVRVAGVAPRALVVDAHGLRNAGSVEETVGATTLAPQERRPVAGPATGLAFASADGLAGASGAVVAGPGRLLSREGPPVPSERGANLTLLRAGERVHVRDDAGPLPLALVLVDGRVAVTDEAGRGPGGAWRARYGGRAT